MNAWAKKADGSRFTAADFLADPWASDEPPPEPTFDQIAASLTLIAPG